jgi:hypothetical protein
LTPRLEQRKLKLKAKVESGSSCLSYNKALKLSVVNRGSSWGQDVVKLG